MGNLIDLSKKAQISLEKKGIFGQKANVVVVMDISISMRMQYSNGNAQEVLERALALGMNMDENQEIDVYLFGKDAHSIGTVNAQEITGYASNKIEKNYELEGGTKYAGVMQMIAEDFIGPQLGTPTTPTVVPAKKGLFGKLFKKGEPDNKVKEIVIPVSKGASEYPTLVIFVTDGDNTDKDQTTEFIQGISGESIFWQFIGIGSAQFKYLESLDNMTGRKLDNANFFSLNDIKDIDDNELYDRILGEYPDWVEEAKSKGIITK